MLGLNKINFSSDNSIQKSKQYSDIVIISGHPKKVYKRNRDTGKLEFQYSVYDGSWGREMSNEEIIGFGQKLNKIE